MPDDARFCPECGQKAGSATLCPHCGGPLGAQDRFCIHCGHAVPLPQAAPPVPAAAVQAQQPPQGVVYRKRCPHCQELVEEEADRCLRCGHLFGRRSAAVLSGRVSCPSCGQSVPDTARICPECGCQLAAAHGPRRHHGARADAQPVQDHVQAEGRRSMHVSLVLIVLAILLATLAIYWFTRSARPQALPEGAEPAEQVMEAPDMGADGDGWGMDADGDDPDPDASADDGEEGL